MTPQCVGGRASGLGGSEVQPHLWVPPRRCQQQPPPSEDRLNSPQPQPLCPWGQSHLQLTGETRAGSPLGRGRGWRQWTGAAAPGWIPAGPAFQRVGQ